MRHRCHQHDVCADQRVPAYIRWSPGEHFSSDGVCVATIGGICIGSGLNGFEAILCIYFET